MPQPIPSQQVRAIPVTPRRVVAAPLPPPSQVVEPIVTAEPTPAQVGITPTTARRAAYPPPGNIAARPLVGMGASLPKTIPMAQPARQMPARIDPAPAPVALSVDDIMPKSPTAAASTTMDAAATARIDGFGQNIPLSVAIEQIVPPDYRVAYQNQPDMNKIVSWTGGRPWAKVLEDMIYAHGYRVQVGTDRVVTIASVGTAPQPMPAFEPIVAAPAPMPAPQVLSYADADQLASQLRPISMTRPTDVSDTVPTPPPEASVTAVPLDATAPALVPEATTAFDPARVDIFSGRTGEPVRAVLARWGRIAGVDTDWQVSRDMMMPQSFAVNTTFARAVDKLMALVWTNADRPAASLQNINGQTLLIVKETLGRQS